MRKIAHFNILLEFHCIEKHRIDDLNSCCMEYLMLVFSIASMLLTDFMRNFVVDLSSYLQHFILFHSVEGDCDANCNLLPDNGITAKMIETMEIVCGILI